MDARLVQILLHSLQFFHYNSNPSPKLTLISYPELRSTYEKSLKEFEERLPASSEPVEADLSDSLNSELLKYCENVRQSRVFELISPNETESKEKWIQAFPNTSNVKYRRHFIFIRFEASGSRSELTPAFHCSTGDFYITYGFSPGYMFILKQLSVSSLAKIFAMVEPTPVIDKSFFNAEHLEEYFFDSHRDHKAKSKEEDPICSLTEIQKFRLCSVVESARRYDGNGGELINTERVHEKSCEENMEVTLGLVDKTKPAYADLADVKITALSCHTDENQFGFLVSHNPTDVTSVFVLEKREHPDTKKVEGRVLQHVRDIALLKYAYKSD